MHFIFHEHVHVGMCPSAMAYAPGKSLTHTQTHTNNFHARSAFVEYVMRQLNTSTFDSGEQLARVAEDRLKRIAGANRSSLLMDLMRHGDCRHKDLQEKVIFAFLCVCACVCVRVCVCVMHVSM